jgi:cell division septation protein DedD
MTHQVVSRTQRRMEKRQALMVLVLLLLTSLVSFSLGVMVGKGGDSDGVVEEQIAARKPAPAIPSESEPGQAVAQNEGSVESELTFYDTLPQGQDNALGSGINLPPEPEKPEEPAAEKVASAAPVKETAPVAKPAPAREKVAPPAAAAVKPAVQKPAATAVGDYVVQVASVKDRQGAVTLRNRMAAKGYAAFVEQADLGAKGVWHRVFAGPFSTRQDADRAVASLKADRIASAPLVRRR